MCLQRLCCSDPTAVQAASEFLEDEIESSVPVAALLDHLKQQGACS
jgi:hypothetical protein